MLSLEKPFREQLYTGYREAPMDAASFHRFYKACGPGECHGLCCNGGSGFYMKEESDTIRRLVDEKPEFFARQGLQFPDGIFDEELDEKTGEIELSTNTRPDTYPEGFLPAHFPATACAFKRGDGACSLQVLSREEGRHGWWYKPLACWLFPIELEYGGKPFIHVAHADTDEYVDADYPGFVGFTKCGAECKATGRPAYQILEQEIAMLGKMLDRDLMAEILAYKSSAA